MKQGFTLIELLVVIGIMGLLGTASVGGYRQLQRGMEERGVMQNVNAFIRAAYQRAQIDRQPTAVYFWNETLRAETEDENEIVVGRAVAVRRNGRITKIQGNLLIDEFGDLNLTYPSDDASNGGGQQAASSKFATLKLYQLDTAGGELKLKCSIVRDKVELYRPTEIYLSHDATTDSGDRLPATDGGQGRMLLYGFNVEEKGNAQWKVGSAYGLEFQSIELPHGYIFGSSYSKNLNDPVQKLDSLSLVFRPGTQGTSQGGEVGKSTVLVSVLRPNTSGELSVEKVGTSDAPTSNLEN